MALMLSSLTTRVKASVALNGAHLLSPKPEGETEVLWLSDATSFKRGGDPRRRACLLAMVWPVRAAGLPSHGFARNQQWTLKAHNEDDNGAVLTFELQAMTRPVRCGRTSLPLYARFKLGKTCEIELEAHGEFERPLPCTPTSTWVISAR